MIMLQSKVFKCACCGLPFARIENGVLIIESRHHGEKHTNVIPLSDLIEVPKADTSTVEIAVKVEATT